MNSKKNGNTMQHRRKKDSCCKTICQEIFFFTCIYLVYRILNLKHSWCYFMLYHYFELHRIYYLLLLLMLLQNVIAFYLPTKLRCNINFFLFGIKFCRSFLLLFARWMAINFNFLWIIKWILSFILIDRTDMD